MRTAITLSYVPLHGGGADLTIPMGRDAVVAMCASLLRGAGVREAAFRDGRLTVLGGGT